MKTFALAAAATLIAGSAYAQGTGNMGAQQPIDPAVRAPVYQQGSGQRAGGPANELNSNGNDGICLQRACVIAQSLRRCPKAAGCAAIPVCQDYAEPEKQPGRLELQSDHSGKGNLPESSAWDCLPAAAENERSSRVRNQRKSRIPQRGQ